MTQFKSTRKVTTEKAGPRNHRGYFWLDYVRERCCAQCWGAVRPEMVNGHQELVCPEGCDPGGHISVVTAAIRREKDEADAISVAKAYPYLDGAEEIIGKQLTDEELHESARKGSETLFG